MESVQKRLGVSTSTPQFVQIRNGQFKHNPAWPHTYLPPKPGIDDDKLLQYMADLWVKKFGTPGQKAAVANFHRPAPGAGWFDDSGGRMFYTRGCGGKVTTEEFKLL
jgi:hypothetical protein